MQQNASLLIAAAFTMIGFVLGRVTAPSFGTADIESRTFVVDMAQGLEGGMSEEDVQVIIQSLDESGIGSDTVLAIPGGTVKWTRNGDQIEVEVEDSTAAVESSERAVVIEKRVVVAGTGQ